MIERIKKSIDDILNESLPNESLFSTANKDYKITEKDIQDEIQAYRKEKMITYEEFLDEPIPVNMSNPMRREDYYKRYMKGIDPKDFYNQLIKIWQEKR